MKGTFFQKPFEFNLGVEGEAWRQGDGISGVLTVKNRGSEQTSLAGTHVLLAKGELKKVHQKSEGAFQILATTAFDQTQSLAPGGEAQLSWKFNTDRNCPITDTSGSLFLLYGRGDQSPGLGQLQLLVAPYWVIQDILQVFQIEFRFVIKTQKSGKGGVEVKLAPPASKAFATMEHLLVTFRFEGDRLDVKFQVQMKKLDASAGSMDLKKVKKDFHGSFEKVEYLHSNGRLDQDRIEKAIRDLFDQLGVTSLLKGL